MTQPALKQSPPRRLVLITPEGLAVYEERKVVAFTRSDYQWSKSEVEEVRTSDYPEQPK